MSTQSSAPAPTTSGSSALDLDAIIKEIEELEKQMDHQESVPPSASVQAQGAQEGATRAEVAENSQVLSESTPALRLVENSAGPTRANESTLNQSPSVAPAPPRPSAVQTHMNQPMKSTDEFPRSESIQSSLPPLLETPVTQSQFSLSEDASSVAKNHLQLKLDGCTRLELTFEVSGQAITVECSDHEFIIRTDRGAEFRLPVS